MRYPASLLSALLLAACSKAPVPHGDAQPVSPEIVQFLVTSAAADFHAHPPTTPLRVRDVHVGRVKTASGEDQYLMCGTFLSAADTGATVGTPFVTLKTSGYEQYVGAQAAARYCQPPSVTWDEGDLSPVLQSRLDSL